MTYPSFASRRTLYLPFVLAESFFNIRARAHLLVSYRTCLISSAFLLLFLRSHETWLPTKGADVTRCFWTRTMRLLMGNLLYSGSWRHAHSCTLPHKTPQQQRHVPWVINLNQMQISTPGWIRERLSQLKHSTV